MQVLKMKIPDYTHDYPGSSDPSEIAVHFRSDGGRRRGETQRPDSTFIQNDAHQRIAWKICRKDPAGYGLDAHRREIINVDFV